MAESASLHLFDWIESAGYLCKNFCDDPFHPEAVAFLNSPACRRVLVACSGGADSVFMLCQLWARAEDLGIQLFVAHYNHRWRGEEAERDARFVESLARQLKCRYVIGSRKEHEPLATETDARSLRMRFLRAAALSKGCQCIAFGHQQDDILETQLQRLARGSGTEGLAAPRPVHRFEAHPTHIRPLLHLKASAIRGALQTSLVPWCEDETNKNLKIPRNALRHSIIPELQNLLEHDVGNGAARSRTLLEEDAIALNRLARELFPGAFEGSESLQVEALCSAPRALARRALNAWLGMHHLGTSLSAVAVDQLLDAIYSRKEPFRASAGAFFIKIHAATLRIEPADSADATLEPCSIKVGETVTLSTNALLQVSRVRVDEALRQRLAEGAVDVWHEAYIEETPQQIFQIRARRPGDSFQPLGAPGKRKLKDWFIDRQIVARERKNLPLVIADSGVIVWVPGFPPADDLKINTSTEMALKLTYKTRKPL